MASESPRLVLEPGERLAGYQVEEFLARGGMAVVYRARDLQLDRTVALKVIAPELAQHDKFRQRFMRESETAASIDHQNIIPIFAAGETDGLLYLVMRYVPGEDLGAVLKREGSLPPRQALPLFTQVAGALDAAHARGLVHRDVKPGNILLAGDGDLAHRHVYLSDFGLTKRLSSLTGFTTSGHFLGTIAYVAPEQVANQAVDHRADIYSLGCVIYEVLVGEPPFVRDDDAALLWAHISQQPEPPSARRPDLPTALDPVLQQALAKDPAQRQPSCRALVRDVRAAFRTAPDTSGPEPSAAPGPARRGAGPRPRTSGGGPAGSASGPRRTRPDVHAAVRGSTRHGGPPRRSSSLTALVLVLALVGVLGLTALVRHYSWESYNGTDFTEAGVAFEHPRAWKTWPHTSEFVVFSPVNLSKLFTPTPDLGEAQRTADEEPSKLVGVFVTSRRDIDLSPDSRRPLGTQVEAQLRDQFTVVTTPSRPAAGGPTGSMSVTGTMTPIGAPRLELYFQFVGVPGTDGQQGEVLLFCRADEAAHNRGTFERVVRSLRVP